MKPRGAGEQERGEGGEAAAPMLRRRRPHLAMQWTFVDVLGCILLVVRGSTLQDYNKVYYNSTGGTVPSSTIPLADGQQLQFDHDDKWDARFKKLAK